MDTNNAATLLDEIEGALSVYTKDGQGRPNRIKLLYEEASLPSVDWPDFVRFVSSSNDPTLSAALNKLKATWERKRSDESYPWDSHALSAAPVATSQPTPQPKPRPKPPASHNRANATQRVHSQPAPPTIVSPTVPIPITSSVPTSDPDPLTPDDRETYNGLISLEIKGQLPPSLVKTLNTLKEKLRTASTAPDPLTPDEREAYDGLISLEQEGKLPPSLVRTLNTLKEKLRTVSSARVESSSSSSSTDLATALLGPRASDKEVEQLYMAWTNTAAPESASAGRWSGRLPHRHHRAGTRTGTSVSVLRNNNPDELAALLAQMWIDPQTKRFTAKLFPSGSELVNSTAMKTIQTELANDDTAAVQSARKKLEKLLLVLIERANRDVINVPSTVFTMQSLLSATTAAA